MKSIPHPSALINPVHVDPIRRFAGQAEALKQLHPLQLSVIQEQKWFRLFVPERCGGLGLSLMEGLQTEEALAWADGSVGWTVTLCAGAGWFIGFLDPEMTAMVFDDHVCIAGSGKCGVAKLLADGYEMTGSWNYATGSLHATAFTANCVIEKEGFPLLNEDGSVRIQTFLFLKEEVIIHENWKAIGMIATGSNGFEVKELLVGKNRSFLVDSNTAVLPDKIYQYPFLQFAEATLAVNSSGMAMRFLDLCEMQFNQPGHTSLQTKMDHAKKQLEEARQIFFATVNKSWEACLKDQVISQSLLNAVTKTSRELALVSRQAVDAVYPFCGLKAADPDTEINRVWRNLHTASQHSLLNR